MFFFKKKDFYCDELGKKTTLYDASVAQLEDGTCCIEVNLKRFIYENEEAGRIGQ
jgi:hypothetical protein